MPVMTKISPKITPKEKKNTKKFISGKTAKTPKRACNAKPVATIEVLILRAETSGFRKHTSF